MRSPKESEVFTTHLVMPNDINPLGTLFGGALVSWMDKTAAMAAQRHAGANVVTASIDHITFRNPAEVGSQIEIGAMVNWAGKTSMEVGVKVQRIDPHGDREHIATAYFTFVAIDGDNSFFTKTSVPKISPETDDQVRRYNEAKKRRQIRLDHKKFFENAK